MDGYDIKGYDVDGYNTNGFDSKGYDKDGIDSSGYDKKGFDKNQFDKNKKHMLEYITLTASIDSKKNKPKLFLDSISGNIHFEMVPFKGEDKFAKLISGGNWNFYDNDLPAYILRIKFNEIDEDLQETFINIIRRTFPKKFQIFPTTYSIGAYWVTDLITEETASYYLRRILENYIFYKF